MSLKEKIRLACMLALLILYFFNNQDEMIMKISMGEWGILLFLCLGDVWLASKLERIETALSELRKERMPDG